MKANAPQRPDPIEVSLSQVGGWTVHEFATVNSTNLVAGPLPAWHAVRADEQTAGRGRFQRSWVSDAGGLWLSAVVPAPATAPWTRLLPLAGGLAVCEVLASFGIAPLRLRWPNDVLLEDRKLAGLLVDQFTPGRAVLGVGVNVRNRPEDQDTLLCGKITRLADVLPEAPDLADLMSRILGLIRSVWTEVETYGTDFFLRRLNALWQAPRPVRLETEDAMISGQFEGIDHAGRLRLLLPTGDPKLFEPHEVRLLRDVLPTP